ncbi:hypothetical protein AHF37_00460 [Paragonimus kellicotti]|nr:hypothetical protein AHF37_00460 [Paragonimus kellicotti]
MREITTEEELEELVQESHQCLVILKLFAEWCGPCKRAAPEFQKISEEYEGVVFAELNVEEVEVSVIVRLTS